MIHGANPAPIGISSDLLLLFSQLLSDFSILSNRFFILYIRHDFNLHLRPFVKRENLLLLVLIHISQLV